MINIQLGKLSFAKQQMGKEDGGLHVAGPRAHVECIQDIDWEGAKIVSREMDLKEKDKLVKDLNHYMKNII